jgi:hypothetical protein
VLSSSTTARSTSSSFTRPFAVPQMCPECVRVFYLETTTKCRFAGTLAKPSDGLEPSTPSLPWRFLGVTRVHTRSPTTQFSLLIRPLRATNVRREASRVSFLMCPFVSAASWRSRQRQGTTTCELIGSSSGTTASRSPSPGPSATARDSEWAHLSRLRSGMIIDMGTIEAANEL